MPALSKGLLRRGYLNVGEGQVHYRYGTLVDAPSRSLLVLLHQSPSSSVMYERLMQLLIEEFDVLALDTPGFGQSDALDGNVSIAALTTTLYTAKNQLDKRPCYLFGHHTGASLAVEWASSRPQDVACLALSGPPLLDDNLKATLVERASLFPLQEDGQHLVSMWQRIRDKDRSAPLNLSMRELGLAFNADTAYPQSYQAVVEHDCAGQLSKIACPTLVFAGDQDPLYHSVEPTLARLAQAEKGELPTGAGTYVCDLHSECVADQLTRFWYRHH